MKKACAAIRFLLQVIGAIAVVGYVLSFPAVQDFLFGTVLPILAMAGILSLIYSYGVHQVREEDREVERERTVKRRIADEESAARQEEYYHAKGLCLNCKPRLDGKYLKALQATACRDAEGILSRFHGITITVP